MSNKPKSVKRLVEYTKTEKEQKHTNLVVKAMQLVRKRVGYNRHVGSKTHKVIYQRINNI